MQNYFWILNCNFSRLFYAWENMKDIINYMKFHYYFCASPNMRQQKHSISKPVTSYKKISARVFWCGAKIVSKRCVRRALSVSVAPAAAQKWATHSWVSTLLLLFAASTHPLLCCENAVLHPTEHKQTHIRRRIQSNSAQTGRARVPSFILCAPQKKRITNM